MPQLVVQAPTNMVRWLDFVQKPFCHSSFDSLPLTLTSRLCYNFLELVLFSSVPEAKFSNKRFETRNEARVLGNIFIAHHVMGAGTTDVGGAGYMWLSSGRIVDFGCLVARNELNSECAQTAGSVACHIWAVERSITCHYVDQPWSGW